MTLFKNIAQVRVDGPEDAENVGDVLVLTFQDKLIKLLITKDKGADADLFLTREQATQLRDGLDEALGRLG